MKEFALPFGSGSLCCLAAAVLPLMQGVAFGQERRAVMLGNSMQGCGIDFAALSQAVGLKVESRASGGILSAHKFALLWHAAQEEPKPVMAVIVFRRGNITRPTLRVTGRYGEKLKRILTDPELERIVNRLAYPKEQVPVPPADFDGLVARSFVPEMARVAREAGIILVLARCKSRTYAERPKYESAAMKQYTDDLTRYLQANRVHFLDYVHEPTITTDCYANGDHLNEQGRRVWTPLMAEDLKAILAGKRAPRERTDFSATGSAPAK